MRKTFSIAAATAVLVLSASSAFAATFNHDGIYNVPGHNTVAPANPGVTSQQNRLGNYVALYNTKQATSPGTPQPYSHADEGTFNGQ